LCAFGGVFSMRRSTSSSLGSSVSDMAESFDFYDLYLRSLGRLCAAWSRLDRELNHAIAAVLKIDLAQAACIATEMNDVAPRCRLLKTLIYTIEAPDDWRQTTSQLLNIIQNNLAPERNRLIHDYFGTSEEQIKKTDRRVRLIKPESFAALKLDFDRDETVDKDTADNAALRSIAAWAQLAQARLDVERANSEARFPEPPQLSRQRVAVIPQLQFPQDEEAPLLPPES
jgi:hypothetical protein